MLDITALDYVNIMQGRRVLSPPLSALELDDYEHAAIMAMSTTEPLDFRKLHATLMECSPTFAGKYRQAEVMSPVSGEIEKYPRVAALPRLLVEVRSEYERMLLNGRPPGMTDIELRLEIWRIAAKLRCFRLFQKRTTDLSYLLQGQMSRARGFSFLCEEFSIETYRTYRELLQGEYAECY